mmetsp:Transcript_31360/g.78447  ORF Transcript_31360/g.78447 Transcript_31360/m.78447 type:complete len:81 (+) Transcript_31360:47-289(+)
MVMALCKLTWQAACRSGWLDDRRLGPAKHAAVPRGLPPSLARPRLRDAALQPAQVAVGRLERQAGAHVALGFVELLEAFE